MQEKLNCENQLQQIFFFSFKLRCRRQSLKKKPCNTAKIHAEIKAADTHSRNLSFCSEHLFQAATCFPCVFTFGTNRQEKQRMSGLKVYDK